MDEQSAKKLDATSFRFLRFTNDQEDAEKEAKLKEAAAKIEDAIKREKSLSELVDYRPPDEDQQQIDLASDTRSLYERLQEQRDKKKEALEESQKLSNSIAKLDEDDLEYLNEVARKKQEEELRKRLEIYDALEAKKRLSEQKIVDEEKQRRELLLGTDRSIVSNSHASLSIKSKLHSLMRVKSRNKLNHSQTAVSSQKLQQPHLDTRSLTMAQQSNQELSTSQNERTISEASDSSRKRTHPETHDEKQSSSHESKKLTKLDSSVDECTCPKDVTRSLGILPSLPEQLYSKKTASSDESNSDSGDEELNRRLVPRINAHRRRHRAK